MVIKYYQYLLVAEKKRVEFRVLFLCEMRRDRISEGARTTCTNDSPGRSEKQETRLGYYELVIQ